MKRPKLSHVFDSDMQFLDGDTFNEVVMSEVELFDEREYNIVFATLDAWDTKSLLEMHQSSTTFLETINGGSLGLLTNIVLDHCMEGKKVDHFKVYMVRNIIEFMVSTRMQQMDSPALQGETEED